MPMDSISLWIDRLNDRFDSFCSEAQIPMENVENQLVAAGERLKQFCLVLAENFTTCSSGFSSEAEILSSSHGVSASPRDDEVLMILAPKPEPTPEELQHLANGNLAEIASAVPSFVDVDGLSESDSSDETNEWDDFSEPESDDSSICADSGSNFCSSTQENDSLIDSLSESHLSDETNEMDDFSEPESDDLSFGDDSGSSFCSSTQENDSSEEEIECDYLKAPILQTFAFEDILCNQSVNADSAEETDESDESNEGNRYNWQEFADSAWSYDSTRQLHDLTLGIELDIDDVLSELEQDYGRLYNSSCNSDNDSGCDDVAVRSTDEEKLDCMISSEPQLDLDSYQVVELEETNQENGDEEEREKLDEDLSDGDWEIV